MAGAIIHILSGVLFGAFVYLKGYGREFVWAGFIGTLFPDAFKYLVLGIYHGNLDFFYVINTAAWKGMEELTIWEFSLTTVFLVAGVALLLYEVHVVKGGKFWEVEELDLFLFVGILIHLIIDLVWIESSWLI